MENIDVDQEFMLMNETLSRRRSRGNYLFTHAIRKQFHLAIVIPFIESQRNRINSHQAYSTCRNRSKSIDLIFYSNQKIFSHFNYSNQCYTNIHYLSADLSEEENRYPVGSANMWKRLFLGSSSLRTHGYTHFFLMEPDTRPIRSYWLDAIVEQITNGHSPESYITTNWWISGSIYRGSEPIGNDFLHINGNALYHLTFALIQFIDNVSIEYPYDSAKSMGYDLDLFLYLFQHIDQAKTLWHKFRFTDLIQNCWHTGCNDTNEEFLSNNPNTYLIHGYKITVDKRENRSKQIYLISLGLIVVIIYIRFFCCRRRNFCRRYYSDVCNRRLFLI